MNSFNALGRLTHDPELAQTQEGKSFVKFRVAIDRGFKDQNGQRQSDFVNFAAWDKTAEFICRYFKKGQMIGLSAQFRNNNWTDQNGQKRYDYYFAVREAYFGGDKAQDTNQGGYAAPKAPTGYAPQTSYNTPTATPMATYNVPSATPIAPMPNFESIPNDDDLPF